MDQWLDSLSEDWPSQPPSQQNSSPITEGKNVPHNKGSLSRIPRRSGSSVSSVNQKELGRNLSQSGGDATNAALTERTSSSLNTSQKCQSISQLKPQTPNSSLAKHNSAGNHSIASNPSTPAGTVAFKASPAKSAYQTPEWKRRVVQGKIGPGDQTDMFGPMGLQKVFKPPTVASRPKGQWKQATVALPNVLESQVRSPPDPKTLLPKPDSETCPPSGSPSRLPIGGDDERKDLEIVHEEKEQEQDQTDNEHIANSTTESKKNDIMKAQSSDSGSSCLPTRSQPSTVGSLTVSTLESDFHPLADSRDDDTFGQTDSKDFTPFYVSKSHTIDGKVDYAAIDTGLQRLHSNMEKLRKSQREHSDVRSEASYSQVANRETPGMSLRKSQMNELTNQSLPEDLSVGTEAFVANGGFINLQRGGLSNDDSFQKRPLSPSSSNPIDGPTGNFTQPSSQDLPSPQKSHRKPRKPSSPPKTPNKENEERPKSSGSPLKLFDKHDTFTNNRLARHISRFEETLANDGALHESSRADWHPSSPSPGPKVPRKQSVKSKSNQRVNSFGSGEFDNHSFDASSQIPNEIAQSACPWDDDAFQPRSSRKRGKNILRGSRRSSRTDLNYPVEREDKQEDQTADYAKNAFQLDHPTEEVLYTAHGKRLTDFSEKNIARKRRRTICSSEEQKRETLNAQPKVAAPYVKGSPTAAVTGRKRKDARYDCERQAADPKTLSMRQILRPRNPTPNQAGTSVLQTIPAKLDHPHVTITGYGRETVLRNGDTSPKPSVDPPTQIVAGALATIALNTVQDMASGSRKPSVTTSDFFNEAQQIMALIRAEKRPYSSHNSAETSDVAPSMIQEEPSLADSTKDNLTRPPSREGGNSGLVPLRMQQSARIVSHLRKYEDQEDLGLALPSSDKPLRINGCDVGSTDSLAKPLNEEQANEIESDPPNIRIRERNLRQHQELESPPSHGQLDSRGKADIRNIESRGSSSSSTDKSQPTGSSRNSANLKKIAPHSVAHLLSDQMADMFFDKERKMWVKRKVTVHSVAFDAEAHATSRQSEEDLFGDIPDLSVDEMEELNRIKEVVASENHWSLGRNSIPKYERVVNRDDQQAEPDNQDIKAVARPSTADGKVIPLADNSSAPSKYTNFAWSVPAPGTRATSYGDDMWPDKTPPQQHQPTLPMVGNEPRSPEVEHEYSILESREPRLSTEQSGDYRRPRVVTVAFSSPLIQSPYQPDDDRGRNDESRWEESPSKQTSQFQKSSRRPKSAGFPSGQRYASRRLSFGNSSFMTRPMSRLDELDEMSIVRYSVQRPQTTTDLAISTPLPLSRSLIVPPTTGHRSSIGFSLSPLADFTVHQIDRPLDAKDRGIVQQQRPQAVSNALSLTAQELVKHLTDTEPYEPYWDHLRAVDLKDRSLTSLHMLDEFCGRTQELDVSRNCIRDLDGVPFTVRSLNISINCISELTAWHTLRNLQYLNVSGNKLRSLKGFQGLLHLRTLKADDNEIESIDGIQCLDGLLSLSLKGNCLSAVNFDGFNLKRLAELDLHSNRCLEVIRLDALESLKILDLGMNGLQDLIFDDHMPKLQKLDLRDNRLTWLDLTPLPNLRSLILDRNAVNQLQGLTTHQHLETLSWRDQHIESVDDDFYQSCHEVRNLYLSSTSISRFKADTPFLNLNTLELACMGLQRMPEDFGLKCRNVRVLNLNYNAIHDIRPLLGIDRLEKLYLAGNRVSRLRRTAAVLDRLSTKLVEVDLRNNTLTVGFYTPQNTASADENRLVISDVVYEHVSDQEDEGSHSMKAYLLPNLDRDADDTSRDRLDEDTKLRRRVYEMLIVSACKALRRLDGLEVNRNMVGKKDGVWERLMELGVLKAKET